MILLVYTNKMAKIFFFHNMMLIIIILVCVLIMSIKPIEKLELEYGRVPVKQEDDSLFDENQTSCLNYVLNKKGWGSMFGNDEEGRKRKNVIAGFQAAQGKPISERNEVEIANFDACVIPEHALTAYNVDPETCTFKGDNITMTFPKTITSMTPKGCMIDFSGTITDGNGEGVDKEQLDTILMTFFEYMNKEDEKIITGLKTEDTKKMGEIQQRDEVIKNKDDSIRQIDSNITRQRDLVFIASGEKPIWVYDKSARSWIYPQKGLEVAKFKDLGVQDPTKMSITFWIDINWPTDSIRNVFHILKKKDTSNMNAFQKAAYSVTDPDEEMYRRPAVYILPQSSGASSLGASSKTKKLINTAATIVDNGFSLQVAVDTDRMRNEHHTFRNIIGKCMIGLVWSGKTMTMYVNTNQKGTEINQYVGIPIKADPDASLFVADRFTFGGDTSRSYRNSFKIRNLTFYDASLTYEMYQTKYEQERIMI